MRHTHTRALLEHSFAWSLVYLASHNLYPRNNDIDERNYRLLLTENKWMSSCIPKLIEISREKWYRQVRRDRLLWSYQCRGRRAESSRKKNNNNERDWDWEGRYSECVCVCVGVGREFRTGYSSRKSRRACAVNVPRSTLYPELFPRCKEN